jgi:micrococcal nuclease
MEEANKTMEEAIKEDSLYYYKAEIVSVYDGDTVTVNIDCGFNLVMRNEKVRLYGIDAPEVRGKTREEGLKSRDALRELLLTNKFAHKIMIKTYKDKKGKYGRYLANIILFTNDEDETIINVNNWMVSNGFAIYKDY